jgi:EmrB/QacA subfamily drug resistance transporter
MSWNKSQKSVLGIVAITSFLGPFLISSVNIALPAIEKAFNMNAVSLSWVITAFLVSSAILLLPLGRWADMAGIKKTFTIGVLLFSITTLMCGLAPSGWFLIGSRFLQGIGGAMTMSTGPAILVSMFPPQQRGKVLGISVASVYMGLAMGPFVGGVLTQQFGWRSIFFMSSGLGLMATIITFLFLGKDQPNAGPRKINLKGSLVYAVALVIMVLGSSSIPSAKGWGLLLTGFAMLFLFFRIEQKSQHPVIDTKLFTQNKLFAFSNLAALINYSATFAVVFLLSLYLQKIKHLTPQQAGSILLVQPLIMTIFSPVAGRLSDKIQPRYLATAGMSLCTLGLALFSTIGQETNVTTIITLLVIMGTGFALFSSPNMNTIMSSVEKHQYGLASGISATMRIVGQMVSMTIVTFFFALYFGAQQVSEVPPPQFLQSMSLAFGVFALICGVGIWFSYSRGNLKRVRQEGE